MTLKRSMYNIEIEKLDNGDILLYNTKSSALGILNKDTQEIYYNDIINEAIINNEKIKESIQIMVQNGFLVDANIDEYKTVQVTERMARYNGDRFSLSIAPTLDCNMACPYCYEDKKQKRMNESVIISLIDFVKKNMEMTKPKHFSVCWYGGEPLLEKEIIRRLSKEFINICKEKQITYSAQIITNGYLLDYNTAIMLKEECMVTNTQITVDGINETHNKRRILKNGQDSFNIITNNIDMCKKVLEINIRVNLDKANINEAEELINYFIDYRKWGQDVSFYFAPVAKRPTEACNANSGLCYSMLEFGDIETSLLKKMYSKNNCNFIKKACPQSTATGCGALTINSFVVDPDGYLYACWDLIGVKDHCIGNIWDGPITNKEYLDWLSLDLPEECTKCNLVCLCQGGCAHIRLQNGNQPNCTHKTISYKENLKILYSEYIKSLNLKDAK
ncbi:SPASM domain-containing protein [Clostridium sporogenes]|uniref:radical SAM/SPASM domain-containing protein n=1 Tax=Clostridium sporogenes TaxID=1509 RepID=UPI0013CFD340|nr:radical SAM protein [Clostridium sporogenes]NFV14385.1 SPASM domain-containing protein [Clostridium sporogenes]